MVRKLLLAGLVGALAIPAVGCRSARNCNRCSSPPPPVGRLGTPIPPPPRFGDTIPPPMVPTSPAPSLDRSPPPDVPESRGSFRIDPSPALPPPVIPKSSSADLPPPVVPKEPARELLLPDPLPGSPPAKPSTSGFLDAPAQPPKPSVTQDPPPKPSPAAPMPTSHTAKSLVGLPGYAAVPEKPGVFAGRKPTLDGFDALKASGFRSVVYLHAPAADVSAARDIAEKRALKFVPVSVSPATLSQASAAFNDAVADRESRPLYVCDDDGLRAGFLWYLHFRTVDALSNDAARVRATPLGLRGTATEEDKQFWLATQQFLATR